jgi:hypothetical protein
VTRRIGYSICSRARDADQETVVLAEAELAGTERAVGRSQAVSRILEEWPRFPLHVDRFVVPISGQIELDDQGMLAAYDFLGVPRGDLIDAAALASGGSLCLLGEPGAGKTTALEALIRDLPPWPPAAAIGKPRDRAPECVFY